MIYWGEIIWGALGGYIALISGLGIVSLTVLFLIWPCIIAFCILPAMVVPGRWIVFIIASCVFVGAGWWYDQTLPTEQIAGYHWRAKLDVCDGDQNETRIREYATSMFAPEGLDRSKKAVDYSYLHWHLQAVEAMDSWYYCEMVSSKSSIEVIEGKSLPGESLLGWCIRFLSIVIGVLDGSWIVQYVISQVLWSLIWTGCLKYYLLFNPFWLVPFVMVFNAFVALLATTGQVMLFTGWISAWSAIWGKIYHKIKNR